MYCNNCTEGVMQDGAAACARLVSALQAVVDAAHAVELARLTNPASVDDGSLGEVRLGWHAANRELRALLDGVEAEPVAPRP